MSFNIKWKDTFQQLDSLSDKQVEIFANQNIWIAEASDQSKGDKMLADLLTFKGDGILRALFLLLPALNPIKVLEDFFDIFKNIFVDSSNTELAKIDYATRICVAALTSHQYENIEALQDRLKICAARFLNCFITETQKRWSKFGNIDAGKEEFTTKISLDPSRIPRLEYVVFSFGFAKPLLFYELLNDMALDMTSRLQSFMLLKSFLILEDAPTYFLIDSELYKTVIISALMDTDVSLFLTAITILTILLPIVATKSVPYLDQLLSILLKAIDWEISYPHIISQLSPPSSFAIDSPPSNSEERQVKDIDEILAVHSIYSVHRCVDQYFTVLYGMFPANIMASLTTFLQGKESLIEPTTFSFLKAPDAFEKNRKTVMESLQLLPARKKKVDAFLTNHKCHVNILLMSPKEERQNPWFMNKESSEIMIACFNLEAQELRDVSSPLTNQTASSLDDIVDHILQINRFLYGPNFVKHLPPKTSGPERYSNQSNLDRVILLKIFYIILMNEGFFKECMRQYHIFHIRQLRKAQINWQLGQASNEDQKLSLETLECELKKAQQLNTHLQSEIKKLESRLKILDLSHSQRFSNTANQLREKNRSLLQSQMDLEGRKLEMKRLEELLSVAQEKIVDFETKMGFFKAEINKNETLTSENAGLRAKLSDSSNGKALTTIKENPNHLVAQIAELQLLNDSLKMQLGQSLEKRNELEFLLKKSDEGGRRISVLQACLDAKTKAFDDLNHLFQKRVEEIEKERNEFKKLLVRQEEQKLTSI